MIEEQQHIIRFYDEMSSPNPLIQENIDAQREFVSLLFSKRELQGCYFVTSHGHLCISRFATHSEGSGKPVLIVSPDGKPRGQQSRLRLQLCVYLESGGDGASFFARSIARECRCTIDRALDEFDLLYKKFLDAHERVAPP